MKPLRTVLVGCGNVAEAYAQQSSTYPEVHLSGFFDREPARAEALARRFGARVYGDLAGILADPEVELVVNLAPAAAHETITRAALEAGKHVHTEKPIALTPAGASDLVILARQCGRRLSCAPATFLGDAQQSVARLLREEVIGPVRWVYAEINQGRIENWHPEPQAFYEVGALWDVGVYPLTILCSLLGRVQSVSASQRLLLPERKDKSGRSFRFERPECVVALLDFSSGATARLSCNFYATHSRQGSSIEFHGDLGSIHLGSSFLFDAEVELCRVGGRPELVSPPQPPFAGVEFARGIQVLARCVAENRPHPTSAELAAHVTSVLAAVDEAAQTGDAITVTSPETGQIDHAMSTLDNADHS